MSSLQENSSVPLDVVNKRKTPFSRSDSFDKFQYTAFYSIQLAGKFQRNQFLLIPIDCTFCDCSLNRNIHLDIDFWKIPSAKQIMDAT